MLDEPRRAVLAAFLRGRPQEALARAIDARLGVEDCVRLCFAARFAHDTLVRALHRTRVVVALSPTSARRWKRNAAERIGRGTARLWIERMEGR